MLWFLGCVGHLGVDLRLLAKVTGDGRKEIKFSTMVSKKTICNLYVTAKDVFCKYFCIIINFVFDLA